MTDPLLKHAPAVYENALAGTKVATLSTNDPDLNDAHTYRYELIAFSIHPPTLILPCRIESVGDKDEADIPFSLTGPNKDTLEVKGGVPLDYENTNNSRMYVPISSTDKSGYTVHQSFAICIDSKCQICKKISIVLTNCWGNRCE